MEGSAGGSGGGMVCQYVNVRIGDNMGMQFLTSKISPLSW